MSSETSTDAVRLTADTTDRGDRLQPALASDDALQPWQLFTLAGLIGATIVVFVSTGQTPAGIILLSLTIFTAAVVGVAAWRTLAPLTRSDERARAAVLGGRTRAVLEREKMLALRSIKDLEFDRAMGKVSEKDFAEMSARLRARATRLMRQLDAGSTYREEIEKEIAQRIGQKVDHSGASSKAEGRGSVRHAIKTCSQCRQENDLDARFCKNCGAKLEVAS